MDYVLSNLESDFFSFFSTALCMLLPVLSGGEATFYEDVTLVEFTFVSLHVSASSWAVQIFIFVFLVTLSVVGDWSLEQY